MQPISEHVYGIFSRFGFLNFYVIKQGDVLTVVDTGLRDEDIDQLKADLEDIGLSLDQIQHILITHAHFDHIGGLAELQERTNATTYVHRLDAPIVRGEQAPTYARGEELGVFGRFGLSRLQSQRPPRPARVDVELQDGQILNAIGAGVQVVHLPGHSYGQCGYWLPDDGVLIGGDVMVNLPWRVGMPVRMASPDWDAVKVSIQKAAALQPSIICVGHGRPIRGPRLQRLPAQAAAAS